MFLPKVGSDACLVLTGTVGDADLVTLDQTFTKAEIIDALKTRNVEIAIVGPGSIMKLHVDVVASSTINTANIGYTCDFTETDGVWSGTLTAI